MLNEHMIRDNMVVKPLDLSMLITTAIDVGDIKILCVVLSFFTLQ